MINTFESQCAEGYYSDTAGGLDPGDADVEAAGLSIGRVIEFDNLNDVSVLLQTSALNLFFQFSQDLLIRVQFIHVVMGEG